MQWISSSFIRPPGVTFNGDVIGRDQRHVTYFKTQGTQVVDMQVRGSRSPELFVGLRSMIPGRRSVALTLS